MPLLPPLPDRPVWLLLQRVRVVTTVRQLRALLFDLPDQDAVVTVIDPHLHVDCHPVICIGQDAVVIESTGSVVTEEDVS